MKVLMIILGVFYIKILIYGFQHQNLFSKFILTTRASVENWYDSVMKHVARQGAPDHFRHTFGLVSPAVYPKHFKNFYEGHNEYARSYFKGDPCFIEMCWEKGDSWLKLCEFLDKEVPNDEFPHANKG